MLRRSGAAAVAVAAMLATASLAACGGSSSGDPGELVHDEELELDSGLTAIRIRFGSHDINGDRADGTGLVMIPEGEPPEGGWPVVAWAHSTTGDGDACAPSSDPTFAGVGVTLTRLAAAGFLAVASDYEGIGTAGDHPYLDGWSEARAIADGVRAARQLLPAGQASSRWVVMGHSQGGHAAAFTAELAGVLAPELQLLGSVPMAMVADPRLFLEFPDSVILLALGYLKTDGATDFHDLLTAEGRVAARAAQDTGCAVHGPPLTDPLLALPDDPGLHAYVEANVVGQQATSVPILVVQGDADPLTKPEVTRAAVQRWCDLGVTVELRLYPADHGTITEAAFPDAIAWANDRFAGVPAGRTCPPP